MGDHHKIEDVTVKDWIVVVGGNNIAKGLLATQIREFLNYMCM